MNRLELFLAGCKAERWKWRVWRASLFTVTILPDDHEVEPYDIRYTPEATEYYDPESSTWLAVEGAVPMQPLYNDRELAQFPADSVHNHPAPIETTYGRMLFNWMVVSYAFGKKIPFQHKIKSTDLVKVFAPYAVDEDFQPEPGDNTTYYYPSEIERYVQALFEITSLCSLITPTGSVKTLSTHPDMAKVRAQLLEENKDRLNDPAVITEIQNKLIALDKEWLKDDNAMDYYLSGKSFSVKRKKMFVMGGIEASFQKPGEFALVQKSLNEGMDMDNIPALYNSIREGSFDRGHDTALGGEKVTFLQRIYQNTKIIPGDCGTTLTDYRLITQRNYAQFLGFNIIESGAPVELTHQNINSYIGKMVHLRRPILCQAPLTDFCSVCAGRALAKNPRAVAAEIAAVGSAIMGAFMSSMHGVELAVAHYDFNENLS